MEAFLTILAGLGGMLAAIVVVVGFAWLLEVRDKAKHDRAMAELDEWMISAMQGIMQSRRELIADYHRKQSPVREACELTDEDRQRFKEIEQAFNVWGK